MAGYFKGTSGETLCNTANDAVTLGEVTVAIIDGVEFAAVDGGERLREEIMVAAKHYDLAADAANGFAVTLAKVGNETCVRASPLMNRFMIALDKI